MKRHKNSFHRTQDACPIWHHAHRNRKESAQSRSLLERFNEIFPNGSFQTIPLPPTPHPTTAPIEQPPHPPPQVPASPIDRFQTLPPPPPPPTMAPTGMFPPPPQPFVWTFFIPPPPPPMFQAPIIPPPVIQTPKMGGGPILIARTVFQPPQNTIATPPMAPSMDAEPKQEPEDF